MKKVLSAIGIFICSLFIFAACGIEGGTEVAGIKFVRDVFYVDYNVSTFLEYKVYPDTATDYYVNPAIIGGEFELERSFTLTDGYITVTRPETEREAKELVDKFLITVQVSIGSFSDTCEVRLRKYPERIRVANNVDTVLAGSEYQIDVQGLFEGEYRSLKEGEFNYKLTSSDESVILIDDQDNLRVKSTGKKGSATIGVQVQTSTHEDVQGLTATMVLNVESSIDDYIVSLGTTRLINGREYNLPLQLDQQMALNVRFVDSEGMLIPTGGFTVSVSGDNVFEIVRGEGKTRLRVVGAGTATLKISSTGLDGSNKPIQFSCKITVAQI